MTDRQHTDLLKLLERVVNPTGDAPVHAVVLQVCQEDAGRLAMSAGNLPGTDVPADCYRFRTGSITKPFTATVVLQLLEEGHCRLEDPFLDLLGEEQRSLFQELLFVKGENYSGQIRVEHLLRHRSGLPDFFADDETFISQLLAFPGKAWTWTSVLERYLAAGLQQRGQFPPGRGFHYSDTNYLLLAVLIEAITGRAFHQELQGRILRPLDLKDTYLEHYQPDIASWPILYPYYGSHALESINTSFDWGGGGLVSTPRDLDVFMRALLSGHLFKKMETLKAMQSINEIVGQKGAFPPYGLGIQQKQPDKLLLWGHSSAYGALMYYRPDLSLGVVLTLNQAAALAKAEWLLRGVLRIIAAGHQFRE